MEIVRIEYDDDILEVIDKMNKALKNAGTGYQFVDDKKAHDGFIILTLEKT